MSCNYSARYKGIAEKQYDPKFELRFLPGHSVVTHHILYYYDHRLES